MRKILLAAGKNLEAGARVIEESAPGDPWLLLNNPKLGLREYLLELHDRAGMAGTLLARLKICHNIMWSEGALTTKGVQEGQPSNFVELLKLLRNREGSKVVLNCEYGDLRAAILQNLIYLRYPVDTLEFKPPAQRADMSELLCHKMRVARKRIEKSCLDDHWKKWFSALLTRLIQSVHGDSGLSMALAASKKSGKSTLLNCLLGERLAPSDCELASPNTILFDGGISEGYWLKCGADVERLESAEALHGQLRTTFRAAQRDANSGFCLEDMAVAYTGKRALLPDWRLIDTPGADAAGTSHRQAALAAMNRADAALFLIDYQKYLTDMEVDYLGELKTLFANRLGSLAICLNKIDLMFQDRGPKSVVAAIDLIRSRLIHIDSRFSDCVILPVSASIWFNLMILRREKVFRGCFCRGSDLLESLPEARAACKGSLSSVGRTAFANLLADAMRMADSMGLNRVLLEDMENFSGVPALAHYLRHHLRPLRGATVVRAAIAELETHVAALQMPKAPSDCLKDILEACRKNGYNGC